MKQRTSSSSVTYTTGVLLVLCAGVCWSFVPLGVKHFEQANAWQILVYRSIGVLPPIIWLLHRITGGNVVTAIRSSGRTGVIGGLGLLAAYAGAVGSLRMTTVANAAFLFACAPFIAALLARFILKESLRRFTLVAMTLATLGIILMVYGGISRGNWLGNVLALVSAIGFAVFTVALRADRSASSLPVVFIGSMFTLILSGTAIVILGDSFYIPVIEIVLAFGMGVCLLGLGMILYTYGSRVVPAAELALLCMTEVIFAPIWAALFLAEYPVTSVLIGGSVIVVAIVLNAVTGMRNKPRPISF